jgi:hypothetical protein
MAGTSAAIEARPLGKKLAARQNPNHHSMNPLRRKQIG